LEFRNRDLLSPINQRPLAGYELQSQQADQEKYPGGHSEDKPEIDE
jgi:hypothetical protein